MCLIHSSRIKRHNRLRQTHQQLFSHAAGSNYNWNLVNGLDLRPVNGMPVRFERAHEDDTTTQQQMPTYLQSYHDFHLTGNAIPMDMMQLENNSTVLRHNNHNHHIDYLDLKLLKKCKSVCSSRWNYFKFKSRYVMELLIKHLNGIGMTNTTDTLGAVNQVDDGARLIDQQQDITTGEQETQLEAELQDFITSSGDPVGLIQRRRRNQRSGSIILSRQESYLAYEKLIIVLNQTKLSNFLLLISYIGLLIKSINYESLARYWAQLKTLNLQNFQSRVLNVGFQHGEVASGSTSNVAAAVGHLSSMVSSSYNLMVQANVNQNDDAATSWPCSSYMANGQQESGGLVEVGSGGVNLVSTTTDICYYLLIVTLMDFLNNLHWYHSERTIKPNYLGREASEPMRRLQRRYSREDTRLPLFRQDKQVSWLKSACDILTSPRHLFQASYVGLIMVMGPLPGTLGALIALHNLLNQIVRHGFNLYRVISYIDLLANRDAHNINESAYLPGYYEINSNLGNNSARRVRGWSYWPVSLEDDGINYKSTSNLYKTIERFLMLSQISGVKVTIFTLLIHLDSLDSCYSFSGLMLFICLVESFLTMHSQYDKYYSRYIHQSPQLESK